MVKSAIWFVCVCLGDCVAYVKNRKNVRGKNIMYKVIMKDTLNWMQDVKIRTRLVDEVIKFVSGYGGKVDKEDIEKSDMCEIHTPDGLVITVLND